VSCAFKVESPPDCGEHEKTLAVAGDDAAAGAVVLAGVAVDELRAEAAGELPPVLEVPTVPQPATRKQAASHHEECRVAVMLDPLRGPVAPQSGVWSVRAMLKRGLANSVPLTAAN
jgi:hypothetical protein